MAGSMLSIEPPKTGPLENYYPVSYGNKHRAFEEEKGGKKDEPVYESMEEPKEKINVSAIIARRLGAQQRLNQEPGDAVASEVLAECDLKLKTWSDTSKGKPGKFTGGQLGTRMSKYQIAGAVETWVRKDFFHNLTPVTGGVGMLLMQKMGWTHGQALGKKQEGFVAPIQIDVKVGRGGLISCEEQPKHQVYQMNHGYGRPQPRRQRPAHNIHNINGKHPVSLLSELCIKERLGIPEYNCVFEHGSAHNKNFLTKVTINNIDYQPSVASPTKKHAKASAAMTALKILGYVEN